MRPKSPSFEAVSRLERPSKRALDALVARRRPFVLVGEMRGWRAIERWTLDWFAETCGDAIVDVQVWDREPRERTRRYEPMPLDRCIARLRSNGREPPAYLAHCDSVVQRPEVARDFEAPAGLDPRRLLPPQLWLGTAGAFTPLHFDLHHNFLAQVRGKKRVVLVPARDAGLFDRPNRLGPGEYTDPIVDLDAPGWERVRWLARARRFACTIEPGEMLFIPIRWRHQVRSLDETISVNFFWRTRLQEVAARALGRARSWLGRPDPGQAGGAVESSR